MSHEVVIEKQSALPIPQILVDYFSPLVGLASPSFSILSSAEKDAHCFQVSFGLIEQAVQAHRGVMVRVGANKGRSETRCRNRIRAYSGRLCKSRWVSV